jgi:hypothetical protein
VISRDTNGKCPAAFSILPVASRLRAVFVRLDSFVTAVPHGMPLVCKERYASEAMSMSDQDNWEFVDPDDAKAEIRAAVGYLLRGATGGARGDIVQEIIAIVRQVASGLPPEPPNSLDDGLPGG